MDQQLVGGVDLGEAPCCGPKSRELKKPVRGKRAQLHNKEII
jgi:hypothetical protein